jgi:hypothetical protein
VTVQFIVLKSVKIEHKSLKMENKDIRRLCEKGSLSHFNLFVAARALVIVNLFALDLNFERFFDGFEILDGQSFVGEIFQSILDKVALRASHLTDGLTSEDGFHEVLVLGVFEATLNTVHKEVQVLLGILLLTSVGRVVAVFLKTEAVIIRVIGVTGRKFKVGDQVLELMEDIIVNGVSFAAFLNVSVLSIHYTQEVISEGGNHEEKLIHRVHVTNSSQID